MDIEATPVYQIRQELTRLISTIGVEFNAVPQRAGILGHLNHGGSASGTRIDGRELGRWVLKEAPDPARFNR
jgi:hypothetical protein